MAFPDGFLDELISRVDIVDVVSRYVSLVKRGSNYVGLCPFHNEKTPSFSVSKDKQFFHCFGCGVGGDAISFIMRMENLDFPDAVRSLAQTVGMTVPDNNDYEKSQRKKRERLYELMSEAGRYFHSVLVSPAGKIGLDYLVNRGLSAQTIRKFGLGFAPDTWDSLIRAMTEKGYTKSEMIDAGLVASNNKGGVYDRFRNRVMFPIIDARGNIIGFGGRAMDNSDSKYLNSPETVIFNKRKNLFNINLAKKTAGDSIILAEGYMDVISLCQAGFVSTVASLGTALTDDQARLIAKYKKQVIIAYDSDGAGQKATSRAIEILKTTGLDIKVLRMTGAKDPDEFIKKYGADRFAKLMEASEADVEFRLNSLRAETDLEDDLSRIEYLKKATAELAQITNAIEREVYINRVATQTGISSQALANEVEKQRKKNYRKIRSEEIRKDLAPIHKMMPKKRELRYTNPRSSAAEEGLVALLFRHHNLVDKVKDRISPEEFSSSLLARAYEIEILCAQEGRECNMTSFTEKMTTEELDHISGVLAKKTEFTQTSAADDYISVIKQEAVKKDEESNDSLLAAVKMYREKKGYVGND